MSVCVCVCVWVWVWVGVQLRVSRSDFVAGLRSMYAQAGVPFVMPGFGDAHTPAHAPAQAVPYGAPHPHDPYAAAGYGQPQQSPFDPYAAAMMGYGYGAANPYGANPYDYSGVYGGGFAGAGFGGGYNAGSVGGGGGGGGGGGRFGSRQGTGSTIKLQGLPWKSTKQDIEKFFQGFDFDPASIRLGTDASGRSDGLAFITFSSPDAAKHAHAAKNMQYIGDRFVKLFIQNAGQ
jgi:hypothetical protein